MINRIGDHRSHLSAEACEVIVLTMLAYSKLIIPVRFRY